MRTQKKDKAQGSQTDSAKVFIPQEKSKNSRVKPNENEKNTEKPPVLDRRPKW